MQGWSRALQEHSAAGSVSVADSSTHRVCKLPLLCRCADRVRLRLGVGPGRGDGRHAAAACAAALSAEVNVESLFNIDVKFCQRLTIAALDMMLKAFRAASSCTHAAESGCTVEVWAA